jgi:transcriptional regulator GlxA family with amidase domain
MFVPAGTDITRRCGTSLIVGFDIETDALVNEVAARTADAPLAWSALPHKIKLASGPAALQAPLRALVAALSPGGATATVRQCEQHLLESLVDTLCATTAPPRTGKLAARRLADLEQWIDAHIDEPITIGQLSRVAGVRDRCLQLAFQARRGMSPIRFVLERRLAAAHALLCRAGESASVTDIATGVGFTHLGRFSVSYRHVFGESPSQTLQRRQLGANG